MDPYTQAFAEAIKTAGMRNDYIALKTGVSSNQVSQWRRGRRPIPAQYAPTLGALLAVPPERISVAYARLVEAGVRFVEIFHEALKSRRYTSFLGAESALPMMYMPDAIRATLELMDAPADSIRERHGYNLGGVSFTPAEIAAAIAEELPGFEISYAPDFRQAIADSWPRSIDDTAARTDWGWRPEFDLRAMVRDMLANLAPLTAS